MLVGNPESFAIESTISEAFRSVSQRALGQFLIHVAGISFGVREQSASLLACSFDEVEARINRRGTHQMRCLTDQRAGLIAETFIDATYKGGTRESYFGLSLSEFTSELCESKVQWAPDGDEAFDDGSHILQFDVDDQVRLVAFRNIGSTDDVAKSVKDVWLEGDKFYETLTKWHQSFAKEWATRAEILGPPV